MRAGRIIQKLREKQELIQELAREGFFDTEDLQILKKLGIVGGG